MPDFCSNSIKIVGPRDKIQALWTNVQKDQDEGGGLLRGLRPEPNYEETPVPLIHPESGWLPWRTSLPSEAIRGGIGELEYKEDEDRDGQPSAAITGSFESAWSPPLEACAFYAAANRDVRIFLDFYEPAVGFVGRAVYVGGRCVKNESISLSDLHSSIVRDVIGAEMDEKWKVSENMAAFEAEYKEEENSMHI